MNEEIISQRNYWNNEADSFQRIYTHQKSTLSNYLDRVFRKDMYERYVFTIENCAPIPGRTFLDVGCGSGLYSMELARKGARRVTGIDIAENMIDLCKRAAAQNNVEERCTFLQTDLLAWDPAVPFDVSIGIGLFDYISDPLPVLRKMREVTTDKAIMSFPRLWTWRAPIRKARLAMRDCSVFFYTKGQLDSLMREAGFEGYSIATVGKLHCVVAYSKASAQAGVR
ncbi:MAG TPA: methyltransferase domain-containing protein [Blastocatellia bacterium]|nr:methyltransferase domain-containing protein [Blastocatellia bacterium]